VMRVAIDANPFETMKWVESLPAAERTRVFEAAVFAAAKVTGPSIKPEAAELVLDWMEQLPADAQERTAYQLGWSSGHAGKVEDVRVWTEQLSDGPLRAAAVEAAVRYRFDANPNSRDKLLEQFPSGSEHDGALAGIAAGESSRTPEKGAQTALAIADPTMRYNVLDGIVGNWFERSPTQARNWLINTPMIPADWRSAWLAEVP
jgi:hypothetical protein